MIENLLPGTRHEPNVDQLNTMQCIPSLYENLPEGFVVDSHTFESEAF